MDTTNYKAEKRERKRAVAKRKRKEMVGKSEGPTRSKLIAEADLWASRAVRLGSLRPDGLVPCYTCGKLFYPRNIQNGHFVGRAHFSVRYDPRNMRPQCLRCNTYRSGEPGAYALKLHEELGCSVFQELLSAGRIEYIPHEDELREVIVRYRELTERLLEEKGAAPWW